jgi:N-methylhydantoinase B
MTSTQNSAMLPQPPIELSAITYEVIRNRLISLTEDMRIALQSASGSPTVTEA